MNYCTTCKKFASALGPSNVVICTMSGHKFKDINFDDYLRGVLDDE